MSGGQNSEERPNILIWKKLRRPFPLTKRMQTMHTCNWENIEVDVLGCLVCGSIHICNVNTCQVVTTSDATVCVISGVCVTTQRFTQDEFCDRVAPYCFCKNMNLPKKVLSENTVFSHINEILCSENTRRGFQVDLRRELHKLMLKLTSNIEKQCLHKNQPCCIVNMLEEIFADGGKKTQMLCSYNEALRVQCVQTVGHKITKLLNFYQTHCQKNIKPMEVRTYVVGLLYLMRSGVIVNNQQVITKVELLDCLLPSENLLEPIFGFKSKNITDIENRFKFFFRQISLVNLQKLCL